MYVDGPAVGRERAKVPLRRPGVLAVYAPCYRAVSAWGRYGPVTGISASRSGVRCLGTPTPSSSKALGRLGYRCTDTCVATCGSIAVTSGTVTANSAARRPRTSVVRAAGPGRASLNAARRLPFDTMSPHPLETEFSLVGIGDVVFVRDFSCALTNRPPTLPGRFAA